MSGTSADGIDVALLETDGQRQIRFLAADTSPYSDELRDRLITLARQDCPFLELLTIEREITILHAQAVKRLLESHDVLADSVRVIGYHGHTIRHEPAQQLTWQIGNGSMLAERTGIRVVYDFRRRDMAAGGEGAPLAALFHAALVTDKVDQPACVLNLGGVGNLTWISDERIIAGDTGPGCGLLDNWTRKHTGRAFDRDGQLASQGRVHRDTVQRALEIGFFERPFPKSADRYQFAEIDVDHLNAADGAATLCAITAEAVARAALLLPANPTTWLLTGGGSRHPTIVAQLTQRLGNVQSIASIGGRPDSLEAECFAWLAVRSLRGLPTSLPATTGAHHATVGGVMAQ
jgi:anhydro-N-acetylmuramic acid kinase